MITYKQPRRKVTAIDNNIWFHDIEVFPNYSLFVFRNRDTQVVAIIEIHDYDNGDLAKFLDSKPALIGYNCVGYDAQIIDFILKNPGSSVAAIKEYSDFVIKSEWPPLREVQLSLKYLDLMEINNYGRYSAKSTSLKQLSFFFRFPSVADTPYSFTQELTTRQKIDVIAYCLKDIDITEKIYMESLGLIEMRSELGKAEGLELTNSPEPMLAKKYFINEISKLTGEPIEDIKYLRTYRDEIVVKDLILPYIKFKTPEFQEIKDFYEGITLHPSEKSTVNPTKRKIVLKKAIEKTVNIRGTEYDYKAGGIHGCYKRGIYKSDENWVIKDIDYTSFYPKLAVENKFSPGHIDTDIFVYILNNLFLKRISYNKKTHFAMNYAYKILINIIYGLSSSEYGPFYDVEYTLKTCVNGMLTISMLIEEILLKVKDVVILQANTDGVTILMPRNMEEELQKVIKENEEITKLSTEQVEYEKMVIYDVNNYMAKGINGEIKQKGLFETRDTMLANGFFHKDSSADIIKIALNKYFFEDTPVEKTVLESNNIHDFLLSAKGTKAFKWVISSLDEDTGVISSKISSERIMRYYVGGLSSISKLWMKDKDHAGNPSPSGFTLLNASRPVTPCPSIRNTKLKVGDKEIHENLGYTYYINEAKNIVEDIVNADLEGLLSAQKIMKDIIKENG
jgi:hypothetical protein